MGELNIYQRINAVMKKVKYVQKDKAVTGGGASYKAVTHDQVVSVARQELVDNGVVVYPEQIEHSMPIVRDLEKNIKMHLYSGDYLIHFVNIDKPDDRVSVKINAQASDNGDKAPGKAVTYATKAAILKVLCLETGDNDESRAEAVATLTPTQIKGVEALLGDNEDLKARMLGSLGVESVSEIYKSNYNQTIANLKKAKKDANI
jgi:hypothetical protein